MPPKFKQIKNFYEKNSSRNSYTGFQWGRKILKLMQLFEDNIKSEFKVLFCYDLDDDNIFLLKDKLKLLALKLNTLKIHLEVHVQL